MDNNADAIEGKAANAESPPGQDNKTEEPGSASFKSYLLCDAWSEAPCSAPDHRPADFRLRGSPIMDSERYRLDGNNWSWSFFAILGLHPRKDRDDFQQFPDGLS